MSSSNICLQGVRLMTNVRPNTIVRACPTQQQQQVCSLMLASHVPESSVTCLNTVAPPRPTTSSKCSLRSTQRTYTTSSPNSKVHVDKRPLSTSREDVSGSSISRRQGQTGHTSHGPEHSAKSPSGDLNSESEAWRELKLRATSQWRDAGAPEAE